MAYDAETFKLMHELTPVGRKHYQKLLEEEADEILWRDAHKFKAFLLKLFPSLDEKLHG